MYSLYELVPVCGIVIFDDVFQNAQELRPFEVKAFWNCFKKDYNLSDAYFSHNSAVGIAFFLHQAAQDGDRRFLFDPPHVSVEPRERGRIQHLIGACQRVNARERCRREQLRVNLGVVDIVCDMQHARVDAATACTPTVAGKTA